MSYTRADTNVADTMTVTHMTFMKNKMWNLHGKSCVVMKIVKNCFAVSMEWVNGIKQVMEQTWGFCSNEALFWAALRADGCF